MDAVLRRATLGFRRVTPTDLTACIIQCVAILTIEITGEGRALAAFPAIFDPDLRTIGLTGIGISLPVNAAHGSP